MVVVDPPLRGLLVRQQRWARTRSARRCKGPVDRLQGRFVPVGPVRCAVCGALVRNALSGGRAVGCSVDSEDADSP